MRVSDKESVRLLLASILREDLKEKVKELVLARDPAEVVVPEHVIEEAQVALGDPIIQERATFFSTPLSSD